jgi:hypothetical protein
MEKIMKTLAHIIFVTALVTESLTFATPAFATRARDAIAGCVAPRCSWHLDADGGVVIGVKGGKGKGTVIYCPPMNGVCGVVRTAPQGFDHSDENQGRSREPAQNNDGQPGGPSPG